MEAWRHFNCCLQHSPDKMTFSLFFISLFLFKCHISDHILLKRWWGNTIIKKDPCSLKTNIQTFFSLISFSLLCLSKSIKNIVSSKAPSLFTGGHGLFTRTYCWKIVENRWGLYNKLINLVVVTFIPCMWRFPLYGVQSPSLVVQESWSKQLRVTILELKPTNKTSI